MKNLEQKKDKKYFPSEIEPKWRAEWEKQKLYKYQNKKTPKGKYYNLVELPYPSGDLHLGHWFAFVPADAYARFKRMSGYNVFFTNGFDAFGLPAENAAIKRGIHPKDWTMKNIENMTKQFATMGTMLDFSDTVITCLPEYYRWNQWIFLKMFEKGIAYRGKALSNWCEVDKTVLANEHIEAGRCWRCGSEVVQKEVEQWFLKITDFADELIWRDPPQADWPKQVREGQNNWIGRSEGVEFSLKVKDSSEKITVYTTRIDTVFGMTYLVVSPEHPFSQTIDSEDVSNYIKRARKKTEMERKEDRIKSGIFTGKYAINPFNGEEVPIWVSDYVLAGYGTGAIMAVPSHDERDYEFAKKFGLPIREVVIPKVIDKHDPPREGVKTVFRKAVQVILINPKNNKVLALRWKKFPWTTFITGGVNKGEDMLEAAKREIAEEVGYTDIEYVKTLGGPVESHFYANHKNENRKAMFTGLVFHLKSEKQDKVSKAEEDIHEPVWMTWDELDRDKNIKCSEYDIWQNRLLDKPLLYSGYGVLINSGKYDGMESKKAQDKLSEWVEKEKIGKRKVNYHLRDWSISRQRYWGTPVPMVHCPTCGMVPVPYEDLPVELPYNVDYTPKGKPPLATDEQWVNVKCPKCGAQGAKRDAETLDTFFDSAWYYYRYISPKYQDGPFNSKVVNELMPVDVYFGGSEHTLGHTLYARFFTKFFKSLGLVKFDEFALKRVQHGVILGPDGNRMSKSKGNVVNPDDVVKEYGTDTVRLYLSFMMPYEATSPWSPSAISGIYRFLKKVWEMAQKLEKVDLSMSDYNMMHKTIKKVGEDLNGFQFNTAVSALMTWLNYLEEEGVSKEEFDVFLKLLSPFAPHIAEELYQSSFRSANSVHLQEWPSYQAKYLVEENVQIVVQINGKLRDTVLIDSSRLKDKNFIEESVKVSNRVSKYLEGKTIKKIIYVEGKLINFVV